MIFVDDKNYIYESNEHQIVVEKRTTNVTLKIINKSQNKLYSLNLNENRIPSDIFDSMRIRYEVLDLFGLSDIELFTIVLDNYIKKKKYHIEWFVIDKSPNSLNVFGGYLHKYLKLKKEQEQEQKQKEKEKQNNNGINIEIDDEFDVLNVVNDVIYFHIDNFLSFKLDFISYVS